MKKIIFGAWIALFCAGAAHASYVYNFYNITNNPNLSCDVAGQLSVEIYANGTVYDDDLGVDLNQVAFKFINAGPELSSICEIYFDDGSLLWRAAIDDSLAGVDFKQDYSNKDAVKPKNLPGANLVDPAFDAIEMFSVEPIAPEPEWGVNPNEWVIINYALAEGYGIQDVLDELSSSVLRIGIHVKAIACEPGDGNAETYSDSFVNIPEPATLALLGLGSVVLLRRKK